MTANGDEEFMLRALALAEKARIHAPPNPWVGCVIVKEGKVIGEGFTHPPGQAHAEIDALRNVKGTAEGATVYVTLEPCCHYGRTPPCTNALIEAKVARVVIAHDDPDPNVSGKGIQQLRQAGIEVVSGIAAEPAAKLLAPYLFHRKTGRPYCIAKAAISIDGRIAAADGTSQWISSEEARKEGHRFRAESQAILIGAGTAIADKARLTVRNQEVLPPTPPLRVILDARGSVPAEGPLFDTHDAPTLIVTTDICPQDVQAKWIEKNVEVVVVRRSGQGVDLIETLELLGKRGVVQAMVEGGGTLLGSFLDQKLLNKLHLFIGPIMLGDHGIPLFRTEQIATLSKAYQLQPSDVRLFGTTVNINYEIQ